MDHDEPKGDSEREKVGAEGLQVEQSVEAGADEVATQEGGAGSPRAACGVRRPGRRNKRREEWKRLGLCLDCGEPPEPGRVRCSRHLVKAKIAVRKCCAGKAKRGECRTAACTNPVNPKRSGYCNACADVRNRELKELRVELMSTGTCRTCQARPVAPGRIECVACLARGNAKAKRIAKRMAKKGRCFHRCGRPRLPGEVRCAECKGKVHDSERTERAHRRATGRCTMIGCPRPSAKGRGKNCHQCSDKAAAYCAAARAKAKATGRCEICTKKAVYGRTYCRVHVVYNKVRGLQKNDRRKGQLVIGAFTTRDHFEMLERQRGRCFWCGTDIRGMSAQVDQAGGQRSKGPLVKATQDHIWARANGASIDHAWNNTLACKPCNLSKGTKPPTLFLAIRLNRGLPVSGEALDTWLGEDGERRWQEHVRRCLETVAEEKARQESDQLPKAPGVA